MRGLAVKVFSEWFVSECGGYIEDCESLVETNSDSAAMARMNVSVAQGSPRTFSTLLSVKAKAEDPRS